MRVDNFGGIQQYHDGRPVADYCNMIPMGNSVIDRHGERFLNDFDFNEYEIDHTETVLETFVDSLHTIYVATATRIYIFVIEKAQVGLQYKDKIVLKETLEPGDGLPDNYSATSVTFTESSTKPSQVYFCDGRNVYYMNTQSIYVNSDDNNKYTKKWNPIKIPLFKDPNTVYIEKNGQLLALTNDQFCQPDPNEEPGQATALLIGYWPDPDVYEYVTDASNVINVSSITWFDNRLVLVERDKNTVWLSAIDPSRWIYPAYKNAQGYNVPQYPWGRASSETLDIMNLLVNTYYSSTASSARLHAAVAFAGQLYFLNDASIEVWSATGNNENPIQHNSQNTIYYGGRSPVIVDDRMYLLCRGAIRNEFVAAIEQNGQITRLSNDEIEQRLITSNAHIKPLSVRDQSMVVVYLDKACTNGYSITKSGYWWRYWNDNHEAIAWSVTNVNGAQIGVTTNVKLCVASDLSRKYLDGTPILRSLRGCFAQFIGRKIIREIEVICDSGVYTSYSPDKKPRAYLRVSLNRGATFGAYLYRQFGNTMNNNHVMVWRNCGSSNSLLLEFGTSDEVRFQVYSLNIEIA